MWFRAVKVAVVQKRSGGLGLQSLRDLFVDKVYSKKRVQGRDEVGT